MLDLVHIKVFFATVNQKSFVYYLHQHTYDGVRRVSGLRRDPAQCAHIRPHTYMYSTEKQTPTLSQDFCAGCEQFEVISKPCRVIADPVGIVNLAPHARLV